MSFKNWRILKLGDVVTLQRGHDLPEPKRKAGNVPVLGSFGITGYHNVAKAKSPGVTVGRSGASFGVVNYSDVDYWPLNTALYVVDFHGNDEKFVYYFLKSIDFKRYNSGSAQPSLNRNFIYPIPVRIPPLDEQKAIAHILGTLDDKIELNREMNQTLEAIAGAIFKSWFIDFDPVRAKMEGRQPAGMDAETAALFPDEFEDSPLGKIPKGWKVEKIENIAARVAMGPFGSRITSDNFVSFGVPVIRGNNLVGGFNEDKFVYLTDEKADELKSSVAFPGDIVFTHRGTLGQIGIIPQNSMFPRYVVSQSQMLLSVNKKLVSPKLVYNFFCLPFGQQALLANTNTTGVPSIGRPSTSLKAIQLVIPSQQISDAFEILVNSLDFKREMNIQESKNLTSIRDTLLPKLLSGEIRVKDAEKVVEEVT